MALTGEIDLNGKITRIGGLDSKIDGEKGKYKNRIIPLKMRMI